MGEVNALMFEDIRTNGSAQINQIFDEYFVQTPPFEGDDLLKMMAKRTYYAREWSLFLAEYPLILSPFLPQPFFRPGRDTEGSEGVVLIRALVVFHEFYRSTSRKPANPTSRAHTGHTAHQCATHRPEVA